MVVALVAAGAVIVAGQPASGQGGKPAFTLKFGVLSGLTGDPAVSGQAWNQAAKVGIDYIDETLKKLNLPDVKVELSDSQDSQGNPQAGVEAAQKLVNINKVHAIIGDPWSGVTSAVARAVAIPNRVLMFTGGTSPALTKLNTESPAFIWQPVASDDIQGRVLAALMADAFGKTAKVNVAARNDAYGTNLSAVFKDAWTAGGGTIPKFVIYNHQQPTLDSEAQEVIQGNPDAWLFIDFCPTFAKLALPLTRTGKWDPAKTFGSDTLVDCQSRGTKSWPGPAGDAGERLVGLLVPGLQGALRAEGQAGHPVRGVDRRGVRQRVHRLPGGAGGEVLGPGQDQRAHRVGHEPARQAVQLPGARQGDRRDPGRTAGPLQRRDRPHPVHEGRPRELDGVRHLAGEAGRHERAVQDDHLQAVAWRARS